MRVGGWQRVRSPVKRNMTATRYGVTLLPRVYDPGSAMVWTCRAAVAAAVVVVVVVRRRLVGGGGTDVGGKEWRGACVGDDVRQGKVQGGAESSLRR
jgi:hypothetical protein